MATDTAAPLTTQTPPQAAMRPELLAPAGDWACVRAAVENGADAVYFGLERFNARMRAHNFTEADLPDLMAYLHQRGVRGYVTFNTLVFESELEDATKYLKTLITAGVDAAIVQDVGVCRLIRELSPDFPIHASTQMTITSHAGIEFARDLGCHLVVMARECSIQDLDMIQVAQTSSDSRQRMPLEVFVHGALCVAYSGQCLTSEVLGGRSANRGECAQACRMPYELLADGRRVELGDRRYLLSPQDLAGISVLPELFQAGVGSLKIEGRLKSPEYVASIVRVYRDAIDQTAANRQTAQTTDGDDLFAQSRYDLEMSFSRGLYTGWFRGNNNQELAHARFGKKRGVLVGEVTAVRSGRVQVRLRNSLKPGDGIVFDQGNPEDPEEGGRVFHVDPAGHQRPDEHLISFGSGSVDLRRLQPGNLIWKTSDPEWDKRVRQTFAGEAPKFKRPVTMETHGAAGQALTLIVRDELGHCVRAQSRVALEPAHTSPLTTKRLEQQLGRLGSTGFQLATLTNLVEGEVILPVSELNQVRRSAIEQLEVQRSQPPRWTLNPAASARRQTGPAEAGGTKPELVVLCRSMEQLQATIDSGTTTLYCDFENTKHYRDAVALVRSHNERTDVTVEVFVAPPRIFKMGEEWILKQVRDCEPDGFLIRNYDHLSFFRGARLVGDFSLNIANSITARHFMEKFGLERLTASYDLNTDQLSALLRAAPPAWFEVTLHQHMPMFHMEHCVFCAFLSTGKDYRDCGRPCDRHAVRLKDRVGVEHLLKADVGCRNTLFNGRAQTGAEFYPQLRELGARRFRIEFVAESATAVGETLRLYQSLLRGEISGEKIWRQLKLQNQLGLTRGQMGRH